MKQEDRVNQTKHNFRMALLRLLQEKPINKISIRELTEVSHYNRSTFYLYYQDIYDLQEDIEQTVLREVQERMERHPPLEMKDSIYPLIREIFLYADENREVFKMLSISNSYSTLTNDITELVRKRCYMAWDIVFPGANKEHYEPFFHYLCSGLIAIVIYWISDSKKSVDEISEIAARLVYSGSTVLTEN